MQNIIPVFLRKFLLQVRNIVLGVLTFVCKTFLINWVFGNILLFDLVIKIVGKLQEF